MLRTVLIIDDCESTAIPLEIALAAMPDTHVILLSNAPAALKILANGDYHVSAVVTDLHLPLMNGFELIDNIRSDSQHAKTPIVVVTGDTDPATRMCAFQKGANAYFQKPYSPANLRDELERLIHAS